MLYRKSYKEFVFYQGPIKELKSAFALSLSLSHRSPRRICQGSGQGQCLQSFDPAKCLLDIFYKNVVFGKLHNVRHKGVIFLDEGLGSQANVHNSPRVSASFLIVLSEGQSMMKMFKKMCNFETVSKNASPLHLTRLDVIRPRQHHRMHIMHPAANCCKSRYIYLRTSSEWEATRPLLLDWRPSSLTLLGGHR